MLVSRLATYENLNMQDAGFQHGFSAVWSFTPLGSLGLGTRNERDLDKRCSTSWGSLVLGRVVQGVPLKLAAMTLPTPIINDFVQQFKKIIFVSPICLIERIKISPG